MTLFLNLDPNILSYGLLAGLTVYITGSIIKNIWFTDYFVNTTLETPTSDSGASTIRALTSDSLQPSPTLHHLSTRNLREIQDILDSTREIGIQTVYPYDINHSEVGIQANPILSINTQNINSPILQSIDVRDINSIEYSVKSTQTLFNSLEKEVQTIDKNLLNVEVQRSENLNTVNLIDMADSPLSIAAINPNLKLSTNQFEDILKYYSDSEIIEYLKIDNLDNIDSLTDNDVLDLAMLFLDNLM